CRGRGAHPARAEHRPAVYRRSRAPRGFRGVGVQQALTVSLRSRSRRRADLREDRVVEQSIRGEALATLEAASAVEVRDAASGLLDDDPGRGEVPGVQVLLE